MSENLDFYQTSSMYDGYNYGRTLIQAKGEIGGHRNVFVEIGGGDKEELNAVPTGMMIKNPFKGRAKTFAGDLVEYHVDGTGYILKTYLVEAAVEAASTTVYIVRDGYKHIPFVGDILMKAPSTLGGTGTAATVTAIESTTNDSKNVWKLTLSAAIGALSANDVLVEGVSAGSGVKAVVTNPNLQLPCDLDWLFAPATSDSDFEGARYFITPMFCRLAWADKLSPMPASVLALNSSRVDGWFKI